MPGTDGFPSMTGLPMTITFVETDAPGTGSTVEVVHGLEPGDGGTGQVGGLPAMSPAQIAGAPPIRTLVCLGITTTGPAWQQVITAEAFTIGGMARSSPRRVAAVKRPGGARRGPVGRVRGR